MLRPGLRGIHAPWTIDNALREDASSLPAGSRQRAALGGTAPRLSFDRRPTQVSDPERLSVEIRTCGSDLSRMFGSGILS